MPIDWPAGEDRSAYPRDIPLDLSVEEKFSPPLDNLGASRLLRPFTRVPAPLRSCGVWSSSLPRGDRGPRPPMVS